MKKPINVLSTAALAAVFASSTLVPVAVQAAEETTTLDSVLVEKDGKVFELAYDLFLDFNADGEDFNIVNVKVGDKTYAVEDFYDALADNDTLTETLESLTENYDATTVEVAGEVTVNDEGAPSYNEGEGTEEEVTSVKAINQTIAKGKDQELTFEVNGDKYTAKTFAEKFGEEGYTVEFLYNTASNGDQFNKNGTVNVKEESTFKYSVQVTDKDGKVLPEDANNAKNFAEVTVKSDAVEKVTEAKLSNDLTYVTMNEKEVTFKATKGINGLGKEVLPKEGETALDDEDVTFERAVSSDSTVAYVEGGKIVPLKPGNVTFDVYFTNVKEPVKVTVEVKAAQEATSMEKIENMKVQTGEVALPEVKVLDQYGKAMEATPVIKVTDKDNKEVTVTDKKVNLTEAGKYTVKVFASEDKDAKQLGSYTIETVKVDENTTPEVYELNFTKDDKDKVQDTLDIEGTEQKVEIDVVGKVDGVEVATAKFHKDLKARTSDDAVTATYEEGKITVTFAKDKTPKVGDVTITLYNEEGAMVTDLQTATVKVVNTAAQIEELKLADEKATALTAVVDDAEALKAADKQNHFTSEDIADQLTAGKDADEEEIFDKKMVKEVKFIERVLDKEKGKLTGKVHVTLDAKYGGKTFVFDAEVTTKTQLESAIITVEAKQEVSEDAAVANKQAEIANNQFKFTAAEGLKGTEGNGITIKFDELGDDEVTETTVSVDDKTITVTLAQSDKGEGEAAVTATVAQVVKAINDSEEAKKLVVASAVEGQDDVVVTPVELQTKDGVDEVKAEAAVDQQITFTFSAAVNLKVGDEIKIGEATEAKEAKVASVEGNVVVVTVPADNAIDADADADATITVKGEGEEFVALEGVNFGEVTVTAKVEG